MTPPPPSARTRSPGHTHAHGSHTRTHDPPPPERGRMDAGAARVAPGRERGRRFLEAAWPHRAPGAWTCVCVCVRECVCARAHVPNHTTHARKACHEITCTRFTRTLAHSRTAHTHARHTHAHTPDAGAAAGPGPHRHHTHTSHTHTHTRTHVTHTRTRQTPALLPVPDLTAPEKAYPRYAQPGIEPGLVTRLDGVYLQACVRVRVRAACAGCVPCVSGFMCVCAFSCMWWTWCCPTAVTHEHVH